MDGDTWGLTTAAEARAYLGEVGRLWLGWMAGLAVLVLSTGWGVLIGGVAVMVLLVWLSRPLQARTDRLMAGGALVVDAPSPSGWGSPRERTMRRLAYGAEPIAAAVELAGAGRWWLVARWVMIAATVAAVAMVVWTAAGTRAGP
ncbi:MAG TPA: hypothetical protein VIV08_05565 [Acidimicrobiia bacterium]